MFALSPFLLLVSACHRGIDWGDFECDVEPVALPEELGIVDDDAEWLCDEADKPDKVRNLGDWGTRAAGVVGCFPGEEGTVSGADIYVAPDGDDDAAGNSADAPLATVAAAVCRASPGQTVHLAPGTYTGDGVIVGMLGSAGGEPVTIRGEGADPEEVVLDGEKWRGFALGFTESHNVVIENLTVENWTNEGIYALEGSGITVRDVVVRNNGRCNADRDSEGEGFGVDFVGTADVTVADSLFEDNGPLLEPVLCGAVLGTGINTFEVSGTLSGNTIRRNRGGAMLVEDGGPMTVEANLAEDNFFLAVDNYWDAGVWVDGSADVTVRANTFRDNYEGVGVMVTDEEGAYPSASVGTVIEDNAITGHIAGVLAWGYGTCPPPEDAVPGWADLAATNELAGNDAHGEDAPTMCDPDFAGGERP